MANRKCPSRHRTCWIYSIAGQQVYWCYQCGAVRSQDETHWNYPTGPGGENPAVVQYVKKMRAQRVAPVGSLGY